MCVVLIAADVTSNIGVNRILNQALSLMPASCSLMC